MASNIPISTGSGAASVASEQIGNNQYQIIKVVDGTAASTNRWQINSDGSAQVSVVGAISVTVSGNASISGTVGASIVGWVPIQTSNTSVITVAQGSIAAAIVSGSIAVTTTPPANQSVSGTVGASVLGTVNVTPVASLIQFLDSYSNLNYTPVGSSSLISLISPGYNYVFNGTNWDRARGNSSIGTLVNTGIGSVITTNIGSVIAVVQSSSILAVPVGSVITVWQNPSIVGTYAEDSAHASGDRGLNVFGVRNDTMASITSTDGDYSPMTVGPVGEKIVANAPITRWIQGTADFRGPATLGSVAVIPAQGSSVFTYITALQVANFGPSSVLVQLFGATSSTVGWTIAPAGGGSNIVYPNALKTNANAAFFASINGVASVLLSAQGFTSRT